MLENDKMILIYGLNEQESNAFKKIASEYNLPKHKIIKNDMGKMTIRDILDGLNLEVFNVDLPEEKIILFNNFTDEQLKYTINLIRETFDFSPILAVITPTSIEWTFENLLEHLIEEREWFKKQKNK
ncbi:hypothetical protein DP68_04695 [Clostridium sp. HMP27]|nr:hypothetical protein DP68_04695 [Clostridium sp. HMP27]